MMKTFCMGEFNKVLKKGTAYLTSFSGAKANCTTPILSEQQYDAAVIHVGINNLLNVKNSTSITQIRRGIIETAQY